MEIRLKYLFKIGAFLPLEQAVNFSCYETFTKEIDLGGVLFKDINTNNPIAINFLEVNSSNKNMIFLGASGTGKSVSMNHLLDTFSQQGKGYLKK